MTGSFFELEVPQSLIERARSGDVAAFEQIYRRFERPVFNLAQRMLGDADAAREILQDSMLKVFQRIDQYRNDAPFWAWLRQIATNEALMRLRRDKHLDDRAEVPEVIDESAPPWVRADSAALERALGRLSTLTRSVLWLYHVEGYAHHEIAEQLGKTISFSKSQVARGTARLRELLDCAPDEPASGSPQPNAAEIGRDRVSSGPPSPHRIEISPVRTFFAESPL